MPNTETMHLVYDVLLVLLLLQNTSIRAQSLLPPTNLNEYDAYGSLFAFNEHLAIIAQNDQEYFTIITNPFTNQSTKCTLSYNTIQHHLSSMTRFIYSVTIGVKQNASQLVFSYIDENWQRDVFLTIVFLESIDTGCVQVARQIAVNMTELNMQEQALVAMDPYGKRAYAIGTYYLVSVDIESDTRWQLDLVNLFDSQDDLENLFFPKAVVITEDQYIVTVGQRFTRLQFLPYLLVLNILSPSNITLMSATQLSESNFGPSSIDITRYSMMSMSFLDHLEQFIVGIPSLDMLLFLSWNSKDANEEPVIIREFISPRKGISFGKSVAFIDDSTYAVLAHTLPTLPWSTSQVRIYSLNDTQSNDHPLIIYPNNQQVVPSLNFVPPPHSILTLVSWKSHLGLVFDAGVALLLSVSPPGYYSIPDDDNLFNMSISISVPCIPGTARNTSSIGPCFLCPLGTKNDGRSGVECQKCATNGSLLCLRGALVEVDLDKITNYNQAMSYPDSPDLVELDDILLHNVFSFTTSPSRCLIRSSLFWALLSVVLGLIIFIIVHILHFFPRWKPHRMRLKKVFTHIDLIGEGERWFGGLVTLAIIVLLVFTCKFSVTFARLYPIESISFDDDEADPCHSKIPNAKFTSGLQLLSIIQTKEDAPIFRMLDEQEMTLSVHFVSTSFFCRNMTMQYNLDREQRVVSNSFNCSFDEETTILSISTLLPEHMINLRFELTGPYFIGGLRVCLSGPSRMQNDGQYTVKELRFCHLFYTLNETLTVNPTVNVKLTKVVNRTVGYSVNDDMIYSGLWVPTLTEGTLSDRLVFRQSGEYFRYLSNGVTLIVDITESEFFMKNIQEPIARTNEIILRTILYTALFLELFGLIFLLIKLTIVPLVKLIQRRFISQKKYSMESIKEEVALVQFNQLSPGEVIKTHSRSSDSGISVPTSH